MHFVTSQEKIKNIFYFYFYIEKTFFLNYNDSNSWYCMHSACVGATRAAFKRKKANTGGYFDGNAKRLYESARWRR
jgi:hypothetical protein